MLHIVEAKTVSSDLIVDAAEKTGELLHGVLEAQFDHTMNHGCVVNINPEGEPFSPAVKRPEIKGLQSSCEIFITIELLRPADGLVVNGAVFQVDEFCLQVGHCERQGNVDRLFQSMTRWFS